MEKTTYQSEKQIRLKKLNALRQAGIDPYPAKAERTHTIAQAKEKFDQLMQKDKEIVLAGRIRSLRGHGGSLFCHFEDGSGKFQAYLKKDVLGERQYQTFNDYIDVGDFIQFRGLLFITKKGEPTLKINSWKILTKSLLPLPEKWHGLADVEKRYRQRYLDLVANEEVKQIMTTRSLIVQTVRETLLNKKFIEVETPVLQPIYGGGLARPFVTHHNALDMPLYLRISTELYLKRLVVGGYENIFEIAKLFRNEGVDHYHNPEFTLLETMSAYHDYTYNMDLVEEIYEKVAQKIHGAKEIVYQDVKINFNRPWRRLSMVEAIREATGVNVLKAYTDKGLKKITTELKMPTTEISNLKTAGELTQYIFEVKVEKTLIQPTIIFDFPVETSPLAKRNPNDPRFVERFEHYIYGHEHGNNYSELNDPEDLRQRFVAEKKKQQAGFEEAHQTDEDFLTAIEHGMPPTTGASVAIDRLVMLMTNTESIKDVIFFPTMKLKTTHEE